MSSWTEPRRRWLAMALGCITWPALAQTGYPGIGRLATPAELRAWDIDVRPDFKGLPAGSGSVERGQQIWETRCASCHGVFGEANHVYTPLAGGTTEQDMRRGRVARLTDSSFPWRTTLMKLPTVSTLWDHIRRAMPWDAPKSLGIDEVYAVTAYTLHLGGIVGFDFVLTEASIRQVQQRLPNRLGMTRDHALWPGRRPAPAPDTRAVACTQNCGGPPRIASELPEQPREPPGPGAHRQREVGP